MEAQLIYLPGSQGLRRFLFSLAGRAAVTLMVLPAQGAAKEYRPPDFMSGLLEAQQSSAKGAAAATDMPSAPASPSLRSQVSSVTH